MIWYLVASWFVTGVVLAAALYFWRLARAWRLVFTGLSNGERLLLMWPVDPQGQPLKTLSFTMDADPAGSMRLSAGATVLAKFPIKAFLTGRKALQELLDSWA